jgi:hypothetical protein
LLSTFSPLARFRQLNQSETIFRFRTLPLDRLLRCSCAATVKEVGVNAYACVAAVGLRWITRGVIGRRQSSGIEEYGRAIAPLIAFALLWLLVYSGQRTNAEVRC